METLDAHPVINNEVEPSTSNGISIRHWQFGVPTYPESKGGPQLLSVGRNQMGRLSYRTDQSPVRQSSHQYVKLYDT